MMIISFARTTEALKARRKSVTRREWTDRHASMFNVGDLVQAWSASPRAGGERIGTIRITSKTKEPTRLIPDGDWEAEGFAYMAERGINVGVDLSCEQLWKAWRADPEKVTHVIRFDVIEIYDAGQRQGKPAPK
jgi:hypothetical protein